MIIDRVQRREGSDGRQTLRADVTFTGLGPATFEVFFTFNGAPGPVTATADPFLVGLIISAMILGEDVEVRGTLDPHLLRNLRLDLMPLMRRWFPFLQPVDIMATHLAEPQPAPAADSCAAAFSGGLDAMYTAVRHRERIDWLVMVQGFDVRTYNALHWEKFRWDILSAARPLNRPVITVATNIREISHFEIIRLRRGRVHPGVYVIGPNGSIGTFFGAVARCMTPFCRSFMISSSVAYDQLYPYGSHPLLDPMISTPAQRILHLGCEAGRVEKLAYLKRVQPETLKSLRVCGRPKGSTVNCSRCEKCLRTMAEARLAGAEHLLKSFQWPLNFTEMRKVRPNGIQRCYWEHIARAAATAGDGPLARASRIALDRRFHLARAWQNFRDPPRERDTDALQLWRALRRRMRPASPPPASPEHEA